MLYYYRVDVSQGIDINKTNSSKGCDIYHYWCFLVKWFKFQPYICNGCYDVLTISMNLSNITILKINGVDYLCVSNRIRKKQGHKKNSNIKMNKELLILKFKRISFTAINVCYKHFLEDKDINNVLVSNKISSGKQNYK